MGKDLKGKELGTGIRQRKDGRYEARALVKGIEINLYGLNLKELKKDFEQAKEQAKQNVDVRWNNITLNEWFEEWFTKYKVPVIKETSIFLRALCACDRNFIRALCGAGDVRLGS